MICFLMSGFPQYAARCVGALVKSTNEQCVVVATRPRVPVTGMECYCNCEIHWIEPNERRNFENLLGRVPDKLIVDGWGIDTFNSLRDQVRRSGGNVYCMVDNNYIFSWREVVKAIRFRLKLKSCYRAFFVPGKSGIRLLRFYGVAQDFITTGMYSADGSLFFDNTPILSRPKRIIFVGQICDRKNIVPFAEEFLKVDESLRHEWTLEVCGCGPLRNAIPNDASIVVHDFVQPEQLADLYRQARVFVLPSKDEHWGVVVHEAALSGCVLLISKQVGAREDFVTSINGRTFDALDRISMRQSIMDVVSMSDEQLVKAEHESLCLANNASLAKFVEGVKEMMLK